MQNDACRVRNDIGFHALVINLYSKKGVKNKPANNIGMQSSIKTRTFLFPGYFIINLKTATKKQMNMIPNSNGTNSIRNPRLRLILPNK